MSGLSRITDRQHHTAHRLVHEWASEHRSVTLQIEWDASRAAHPHLSGIDPVHRTHLTAVVDRLGGEYASRIIGRTVTSLHDLTSIEASQVISALMKWKREQR